MVAVRRVVQHARDIRPVGLPSSKPIATVPASSVQAVGVPGIRPRLTDPQALEPVSARPVKQHIHPVASVFIDMPVGVVFRVLVTRAGSVPAITGRAPAWLCIAVTSTPSANSLATSSPPVTFQHLSGQSVGQLVVACIRVRPFR